MLQSPSRTCLADEELVELIEGIGSSTATDRALLHVDECSACRELLADLMAVKTNGSAREIPAAPLSVEGLDLGEYRHLELIGRGAMGEVYRAQDTLLDRHVAIKFLSASFDPSARVRFLREARAVARLSHPNVVSIYRYGTVGAIAYLVAELASGQPLDKIEKPLPWSKVQEIAIGLSRGLGAAHRQGILHRDIKPANVVITSSGEIKLLDFGLAKLVDDNLEPLLQRAAGVAQNTSSAELQVKVTASGVVVGTPRYMAPEIWSGAAATEASDVYSLGALLYELCAGTAPHQTCSFEELRWSVERGAPITPLSLGREGERFASIILTCLARDPADRFVSAVALSEMLEAKPAPRRSKTWPRILAATAMSIAVLGSWLTFRAEPEPAARSGRIGLAVLPVTPDSHAQNERWRSVALSEIVSAQIASRDVYRVASLDRVAEMNADLSLGKTIEYSSEILGRIRKYAPIDVVVFGHYAGTSSSTSEPLQLYAQDTASGEILASVSGSTDFHALGPLIFDLENGLRRKQKLPELGPQKHSRAGSAVPQDLLALRHYATGLDHYRNYQLVSAKQHFEEAARIEPEHALTHFMLSKLSSELSHDEDARREAALAHQYAFDLTWELRLRIEAWLKHTENDQEQASELYRQLWILYPDQLEYGLELARDQSFAYAKQTLEILQKQNGDFAPDPRIDLLESDSSGSIPEQIALARRAAATARLRGTKLVVAEARSREGWALSMRGDADGAAVAWKEAVSIYAAAGDVARAATVRRGLAGLMVRDDNLTGALREYEYVAAVLRDSGSCPDFIFALHGVANCRVLSGDLKGARAALEEALAAARKCGHRKRVSQTLHHLGRLYFVSGDLTEAKRAYDGAVRTAEENGDTQALSIFAISVAELLVARGDFDTALHKFEGSLARKEALGQISALASDRRGYASLLRERGELEQAESQARRSIEEVSQTGRRTEEALSLMVLVDILLAKGDREEMELAADRARALTTNTSNVPVQLRLARMNAQARSPSDSQTTTSELRRAREKARKLGFVAEGLALQLALARLGEHGRVRTAALRELEQRAGALGFQTIAAKARAARAAHQP